MLHKCFDCQRRHTASKRDVSVIPGDAERQQSSSDVKEKLCSLKQEGKNKKKKNAH